MRLNILEIIVGLFVLIGLTAVIVFIVNLGSTKSNIEENYTVNAYFQNIGTLRIKSNVVISGIIVGFVQAIELDPKSFEAKVTMSISNKYNYIPFDSSVSIFTSGLLGDHYISINPGLDFRIFKGR